MMRGDYGERAKKMVLVTVGTTSFDTLVKAVDSKQVKEELFRKGYTDLLIQTGCGSYIPSKFSGEDGSLAVDYFTFSPNIAEYLRSASLVISHAGSGSIFETLHLCKPLIVVVNKGLMHNHQSELAEELAERTPILCSPFIPFIKPLQQCYWILSSIFHWEMQYPLLSLSMNISGFNLIELWLD